jgi:hypothetical protein
MRVFLFLAALAVVGLVVTGAIKMQKSSDNTVSIEIDKQKVKQEAEIVVEKGQEFLHDAETALEGAANRQR